MTKGIFMHRGDSQYDDVPAHYYQFPQRYLSRAEQFVGDWIVYLEPGQVKGSRGYFAVAKVSGIRPDPVIEKMYIADIAKESYLDFGDLVPFRDDAGYTEQGVLNAAGKVSGRAQAAVRPLSDQDFARIIERGLTNSDGILPRVDMVDQHSDGFAEDQMVFHALGNTDRSLEMSSRAVRNANFRKVVLRAYGERCCITGLRFINGGGRAEVQAAHIVPVEKGGPDIVSNGLALSGTAHWMFDRGMIGIDDNMRILVSRHSNDPSSVKNLINKTGQIIMPHKISNRPNLSFTRWHRENVYKQ